VLGLSGKSYGQTNNCNLVYGTAIGYVPCATGQGVSQGSFVLSIFNTLCSCSGPWTYQVFQSQGVGSILTSGPALFSSPSPVWNTSSDVWNLPVGNYVARISNVNGVCASTNNNNGSATSIVPFTFSPVVPIAATINSSTLACFNSTNGTISVSPTGGPTVGANGITPISNYIVILSPSADTIIISPGGTATFSNLSSGTYQVKVKKGDCEITIVRIITPPLPLT